ncbi:DUF3987 domain-containing protein [Paracoccus tibetensis]|uniref:Bifunctional DNA primase/polymerase, N-terminal n=1 Tax=Paracoccus tibetensis TaxID=336292 RepID=A0A1G5IZ48_9RHOB|nr:DUF3987 domain-containing protein [Paracoccus tibetensis]SCY80879.1 Bifunctional DNA primase/polymerase, N-terminal [Paracoccus tibetensis]
MTGSEQNEQLAGALDAAKRGWHVFPAPPGQKKSHKSAAFSGGRLWGATKDVEEIADDWSRWPAANVGLPTGRINGFFVVDLDTADGHGVDGLGGFALMADAFGLPDTVTAGTPSGGRHLYFQCPDDVRIYNSQGAVLPGVDVRGEGGMVLAPPSVKPGVSAPYRWINAPGEYLIAECPAWLLKACLEASAKALRPAPRSVTAAPAVFGQRSPAGKTAEDYEQLIEQLAEDGAKHAAVRDVAASMAAQGCTPQFVEGFIRHHCPVWDDNVENSIRSAFEKFAEDEVAQHFAGDPVDLWGRFDPPALPSGLLPEILETFARTQGEQMGADPAGLAVAALVTCAAAIPDRIKAKVKQHDDQWFEAPRIWAALVGSPSTKKSPILGAATEPLRRIDTQLFRDWQGRMTLWAALTKEEQRKTPKPVPTRLRIEDATVEATQAALEHSPDGAMMLQDELTGFFGMMDKYSGGKGAAADRAFWLRSFNGGEYALDRVGRGSALIENLSICLLGGIQPEPIRKIAADTQDDGLLQRLFPIVLAPATQGRDAPAPPVAGRYGDLVRALRNPAPIAGGGLFLQFGDEAQSIRRKLEAAHLRMQSTETISRKLASHIGKYDGLFVRLCIIWHCVEHAGAQMLPQRISAATAERVGAFLHDFLLRHAFAFYAGVLGLSEDHDRLAAIAGHILARKLDKITNRDVQRGDRTMRSLRDQDIQPLLQQLAAMGWLEKVDGPRPSSAPHWLVNPAVHGRFAARAQAERERREEARQVLAGLAGGA